MESIGTFPLNFQWLDRIDGLKGKLGAKAERQRGFWATANDG
jgi:hypothetical protein